MTTSLPSCPMQVGGSGSRDNIAYDVLIASTENKRHGSGE